MKFLQEVLTGCFCWRLEGNGRDFLLETCNKLAGCLLETSIQFNSILFVFISHIIQKTLAMKI